MCSISGYTGLKKEGVLEDFNKMLFHRGPDDSGIFENNEVHLSMNRLEILDFENGKQPMSNEDKSLVIIFNGEIYNYIELREELINEGATFNTQSDTEVVLKGYEKWGHSIFNRLNGMFALGIYDNNISKIILARDHLGKKPLYYFFSKEGKDLFFASEFKSLSHCFVNVFGHQNDVNQVAIAWYFAFKSMPDEWTINKKICKLSPGNILEFDLKSKKHGVSQFYTLAKKDNSGASLFSLNEQFEKLLLDSVRIRMRSDVEIGTYLSGGVDSSLVTAMASSFTAKPLRTYSLVYNEDINNKKADQYYSKLIASKFGTKHTEVLLTADSFIEELPKIVKHYGQPNCAVFSNWFLSKEISKGVKVALSGDGADEIFGSYFLHRIAAAKDSVLENKNQDYLRHLNSYEKDFYHHSTDDFFKMIDSFAVFNSNEREQLFFNRQFNLLVNNRLKDRISSLTSKSFLDKILEFDCKNLLVDQILNYTDLLSMAHSLEVRTPFLDFRLVEYVFSIPSKYKIRDGITKYLLKKVAEKYLPKELIYRPKEGFIEPNIFWLKTYLESYAKQIILSESFDQQKIFNKDYVLKTVNDFFIDGDFYSGKRVWCLLIYGIYELEE